MEIKTSNKKNPVIAYLANFLFSYLKRYRVQVVVVLAILYSILLFLAGILVHKSGVVEEVIKPALKDKRVFLRHLARGMFLAKPEHITIDIRHNDFQKLEYKRQKALEMNKLMADDSDYVPADIRYNDKTIKVRLRLKGDHTDHLEGGKWSFRIKLRGKEALFGMKQFSIQHPKTRNYIYEWLYHSALKKEGLISLRYDFIDVTLNGKGLGIYAMEEFFEKQLIEHNRLRDAPIVRFNEDLMWEELLQRGETVNSGTYLSSSIDSFQSMRTLGDPVKRRQFIKAISLLESFRRGELKTGDVFDVEKLAAFFAISDLMGAQHATIWMNMRFYFNPITARLEPIGFDGNGGTPIDNLCLKSDDVYMSRRQEGVLENFYAALSNDKAFFRQYIKELERVSDEAYLDKFFNGLGDELQKKLDILYKEFPHYTFSKDVFYHNQHIINVTLNPGKTLHAYFNKAYDEAIELDLGNIQSMDAEVLGLSCENSALLRPLRRIILPGKIASQPVQYKNIKFFFPEDFSWKDKEISDLKVKCRIFGTKESRYEDIFPHTNLDRYYVDNDFLRQKPNAHEFGFIISDESTKRIIIKSGKWDLSRDLIIPKDFTFVCSEATRVNLLNRANILSYSPLQFTGSEERPIVIYSEDSTGEGLTVMSDGAGSVLKNVIFKNLSAPTKPGWELTGAVTFYESPVNIYECQFVKNRSEDGLNIIRSEFNINRTLFSHTSYDAFDSDFGKGKVANSSFVQCGNDGIDLSGSEVEIENVFIDGIGDKGISVGELSSLIMSQVEIKNSSIAVAGKDLSTVNIRDIDISDCKTGFAVYKKKPEYGPARIDIELLKTEDIGRLYLVEEESVITIDKTNIQPNERDVYKLLYGGR